MKKLMCFIKQHKNVVLYIIFGLLTTLVNYLVYFPLYYIAGFSATLSNVAAWFVAVLFSFCTNKPFVFHSDDWSFKTLLYEFSSFICCRLVSGLMETAALYLFVDYMGFDGFALKLIISSAVVILNYITSRIFVFRK